MDLFLHSHVLNKKLSSLRVIFLYLYSLIFLLIFGLLNSLWLCSGNWRCGQLFSWLFVVRRGRSFLLDGYGWEWPFGLGLGGWNLFVDVFLGVWHASIDISLVLRSGGRDLGRRIVCKDSSEVFEGHAVILVITTGCGVQDGYQLVLWLWQFIHS